MIELAILKNFDSPSHTAGVQLIGSITAYFDDVSVARNIAADQMVVGRSVILAIPGGKLFSESVRGICKTAIEVVPGSDRPLFAENAHRR